jgi:hypothetical protein
MRNLLALVLAAGCYNPDITSGGFACNSMATDSQCPDGYSCQVGACINPLGSDVRGKGADGCCVKVTGNTSDLPMVMIPKTGAPYSGAHTDPGLNTPTDCPDADLEPNDGPDPNGQPLKLPPLTADMPTPKIVKLSICPVGNSPATGRHDVDFFKLDNTGGPSLTLMAQVFYDISMGDLDIGIFTYDGHQLNSLSVDGTAVTNGCAAAAIQDGIYYVVVAGANNVDVNRYELLVRTFSAAMSCPATP